MESIEKLVNAKISEIKDIILNTYNGNQIKIENEAKQNKSYASVSAKNNVLVVKPKNGSKDLNVIKDNLRENINTSNINGRISMGKHTKNGGLLLKCKSNEVSNKLEDEIKEKLGENYQVKRPEMRRNKLKVLGIHVNEYDKEEDELIRKIINQN